MNLVFDKATGCVTQWEIPGWPEPLRFLGAGCEFSNWFGFFAHERLSGLGVKFSLLDQGESKDPPAMWTEWKVQMKNGRFKARVSASLVSEKELEQSLVLTVSDTESMSWIGDCVLRFVIPLEQGITATIDGSSYAHQDTNTMRETEGASLSLNWPDGRVLHYSWSEKPDAPLSMTPYLYARDQKQNPRSGQLHNSQRAWVLHARLLVEQPAAFVYRFYKGPAAFRDGGILMNAVFNRFKLREHWRAAELKAGLFGQTQGIWPLLPGQCISMRSRLRAENHKG